MVVEIYLTHSPIRENRGRERMNVEAKDLNKKISLQLRFNMEMMSFVLCVPAESLFHNNKFRFN